MNTLELAIKNIKKNTSFYLLYFVSVAFILSIFFSFKSFSMNKIMMEKISQDGRVEMMSDVIGLFFMGFVVFYMAYSNKFFVKRRMRELGIYMLMGYRKSKILLLITCESVVTCVGALIISVIIGSAIHMGIIWVVVQLLHLSIDWSSIEFINMNAVIYSGIFVMVTVIGLCLSNVMILKKMSLLNIVKMDRKAEKNKKPNMLLAIIGLCVMASGDLIALNGIKGKESLWCRIGTSPMGLIMIFCIALGTALLINYFLPFVVEKLKCKKNLLYSRKNIIVLPKFVYRIRTNARALIMLSLLSAATIGVFGAMSLTAYYPIAAVERIIPSAFEYRLLDDSDNEKVAKVLNENLKEDDFRITKTEIIKITSDSTGLPSEYSLSEEKGRIPGFEAISLSKYNELLKNQGKEEVEAFETNECIVVKYYPDKKNNEIGMNYGLNHLNGDIESVSVKDVTIDNPIGFGNTIGTIILSDELFNRFKEETKDSVSVMSINGKGLRNNAEIHKNINDILEDNQYFASAYGRCYEIMYYSSSTFLLMGFLTVLFFVASGTILHFHNTSAMIYDKSDYDILHKLGYSKKRIKGIVKREVRLVYLIPFIIGSLHALCGVICYKALLINAILSGNRYMILAIILSIGVSALIYYIYYNITKKACFRIVFNN